MDFRSGVRVKFGISRRRRPLSPLYSAAIPACATSMGRWRLPETSRTVQATSYLDTNRSSVVFRRRL
ncbi:MAG: hypothetical protein LBL94_00420 [Prevotellaceae bacterium]|nr:hypothetical protein [Prevotellaceae bacterium]